MVGMVSLEPHNDIEVVSLEWDSNKGKVLYAEHIDDVASIWEKLNPESLFMRYEFLKALEVSPPSGMNYRYVIVMKNDVPQAGFYYQFKKVNFDLSLGLDKPKEGASTLAHIRREARRKVAKAIRSYILVNGNMTITGVEGFIFRDKQSFDSDLVEQMARLVRKQLKKEGILIRGTAIKDISKESQFSSSRTYNEFLFQPNMIVPIHPEWTSYDDYLSALKSKYRVRANKCRKKLNKLTRRDLGIEELKLYRERMHILYNNVIDNADFNLFILPEDYFITLKEYLQENIIIKGYFFGDLLVGFSTIIRNGNDADAHFLGYQQEANNTCSLYQNMLYEMIEQSIEWRSKNLVLSRTAMAIKSSVGAVPEPLYVHFDTGQKVFNYGLRMIKDFLQPKVDWVQRSPFKDA